MVEIIPKKPEREIPFKNVFLFVAGALLLAVVLGYVIIVRVEAETLTILQDIEDGIAKIGVREDRSIETKVFDAEKKIKDTAVLLASRRKSSSFFNNFASLIHPQVWLSEIGLDVAGIKASVSGVSPNFKILERQLVFLQKQNDLIDFLDLSSIAIGDKGAAEFSIVLSFKPEIFNATSVAAFIK